eukprot:CAMPEP_0118705986 /NCGR_PEP_ID=MMETSP0800-20121206/20253_1 /TAXON_ID=210618 ORGANISM="Striatella unipunctata, Strain CCMP2910" /NCGR_SAMPLE_ID=MMETSP0800 /ASSEMBLY_ACC=CAM_ASM_000638 /LENGTH=149 /DNA_ID=CAMNT_0006608363 /DNA_START=51 /DNA_END=500 /DNA_ORIENTATION=-
MGEIDNNQIQQNNIIEVNYVHTEKQEQEQEQLQQQQQQQQQEPPLVDAIPVLDAYEPHNNPQPHNYTGREMRLSAGVGVGVVTGIVLSPPIGIILGLVAAHFSNKKGPVGEISRVTAELSLAVRDKFRELKERRRLEKEAEEFEPPQHK